MHSPSDLIAINQLKRLAGSPHFVKAELDLGDNAVVCKFFGKFSHTVNEGFKVKAESSLFSFEESSVQFCEFDENLASPTGIDLAIATSGLTVPFTKITLLNGIKINISCPVPDDSQ